MDTQNTLDHEVLQSLRDALEDELNGLIEVFISRLPALIGQIKEAIADEDLTALHFSAHSLKGASGNFGAKGLHNFCTKLEASADAKDLQAAAELFDAIEKEAKKVEQVLTEEWLTR